MSLKCWQFLAGVLAVLAGSLACSLPAPGPAMAPTHTPSPVPTVTQETPVEEIRPKASPAGSPAWETVSASFALNVRSDSEYGSEALGVLYHGAPVYLTGRCRGVWAEIRFEGRSAWVNSRYITGDVCEAEK